MADRFDPFQSDHETYAALKKSGLIPMHESDRSKRRVIGNFQDVHYTFDKDDFDTTEIKNLFQKVTKQKKITMSDMPNQQLTIGTIPVWRQAMNFGTNFFREGDVNNYPSMSSQHAIQMFQKAKALKGSSANGRKSFYSFDIETMGEKNTMEHISEIAIPKFKFDPKLKKYISEAEVSFLLAPDKKFAGYLNELISKAEKSPFGFLSLTDQEQHTLTSLIRYSNESFMFNGKSYSGAIMTPLTTNSGKNVQFGGMRKGQYAIKHHSFIDEIFPGDHMNKELVQQHFKEMTKLMRSGLRNLEKQGVDAKNHGRVLDSINQFLKSNAIDPKTNQASSFFISQNGEKFDVPFMERFFAKNGVSMSKDFLHLDLYKLLDSVLPYSMKFHETFGRDPQLPFGKTTLGLQEMIKTLGMNQLSSHAALSDAIATGDVFLRIEAQLNKWISQAEKEGKKTGKKNTLGFTIDGDIKQRGKEMSFSQLPITEQDILFSKNAVRINDRNVDFTAEFVNGKFNIRTDSYHQEVIQAESFYKIAGVTDLSTKQQKQFVLELINTEDNTRSFINRQGEYAEQELIAFIHKNFTALDFKNPKHKEIRSKTITTNLADKARRMYEDLFQHSRSVTKGMNAASRLYANAAMIKSTFASEIDDIIKKADRSFGPGKKKKMLAGDIEIKRAGYIADQIEKLLTKNPIALNFESLWQMPFGKESGKYVHNEMERRKFMLVIERLMAESDIYLPAIDHIVHAKKADGSGPLYKASSDALRFSQEQSDAFLEFSRLVDDRLGQKKITRSALPFEANLFQYKDRLTGEMVSIDVFDHNRAKSSIHYHLNKTDEALRQKIEEDKNNPIKSSKLQLELKRTRQEKMASMLAAFAQQNFMTYHEANKLNTMIMTDQLKQNEFEHQMANLMMNHPSIHRKEIDQLSISVRKGTRDITQQIVQQMIESIDQKVPGLTGNLQRKTKPIYSSTIDDLLTQLDRPHTLNQIDYLIPNHKRALDRLMNEIANGPSYAIKDSKYKAKPHVTLQLNDEATELIVNVYRAEHSKRVRSLLTKGAVLAENQAIQWTLPLISSKGTMAFGNKMLNAQMHLIMEKGQFINVSSFEKMIMELIEKGSVRNAMVKLSENRIEEANRSVRSKMNDVLEELAGVRRDPFTGKMNKSMNDTLFYRGSESDYLKQFVQHLESGMIHHFYKERPNEFGRNAFFDQAFVNVNGKDMLRTFVSMDDVKFSKREELIYAMNDWISKGEEALPGMNFDGLRPFMGDYFWSGIKSTHAGGSLSAVDMRSLLPFGYMLGMQKDNTIQYFNRHPLKENFFDLVNQNHILQNSIFKNELMIETPNAMAFKEINPVMAESKFYGRVMLMTQTQLENRIQELLFGSQYSDQQRKNHLELMKVHQLMDEKGRIQPRDILSLYEHQVMVSDQLMKTIKYDYQKQISVSDTFQWDEKIATRDKKGNLKFKNTMIQPDQLLGIEDHFGSQKEVRYQERFAAQIVSGVEDQKIQLKAERTPSKFQFGLEKGTLSGGAPMGVSHEVMSLIAGRNDVIAFVNANLKKNQYEASVFEGMFNELSVQSRNLSSTELASLKKYAEKTLIEDAGIDGLKIGIEKNQLRFVDMGIKSIQTIKDGDGNIIRDQVDQVMNFFEIVDQKYKMNLLPQIKGTTSGIFPIVMSHVDDYSAIAIDQQAKSLSIDAQFMNVIQNKGLNQTYRSLLKGIVQNAKATGLRTEAKGLVAALDYLQTGTMPDQKLTSNETMSSLAFLDEPLLDRSPFHFSRTIHDNQYIRDELGLNRKTHAGFFMKLPEANINGQNPFVDQSGKPIDKVFIPFLQNNGHDGNWYLRPLQKEIENIKKRAANVERDPFDLAGIQNLQEALTSYHKQLTFDVTGSSGYLQQNAFRMKAKTSSRGLAKVAPIAESAPIVEKYGQYVMLSKSMAEELGILNQIIDPNRADGKAFYSNLANQKEFYTLVPRPPYYAEHAIQHARVFVDMSDQSGLSHITDALTANYLKADSDGDFISYMISHAKGTQHELKNYAQMQKDSLLMRYENLYQNQIDHGVFDPKQKSLSLFAYEQEMAKAIKDDATRSFDPRQMAMKENAAGILENVGFQPSEINSTAEKSAKIGKAYVGMVHNLNRAVQAVSRSFAMSINDHEAISKFMNSLEQDLTISAKNTYLDQSSRVVKSGIYDMYQAVKRFDFNEAAAIDDQYLGGKFSNEKGLKEAGVAIHRMLQNMYGSKATSITMDDLFADFPHLKIGMSKGIRLDGSQNIQERLSSALDTLLLRDSTTAGQGLNAMEVGNPAIDILHHVMGTNRNMPMHGPALAKAMSVERDQITMDATQEITSLKGLLHERRGTETSAWLSDLTGGMVSENRIQETMKKMPNNWKRYSLGIAAAIALGSNMSAEAPVAPFAPNPQKAQGSSGNYGPLIGGQLGSAGLPSHNISIQANGPMISGDSLTKMLQGAFDSIHSMKEKLNVTTIIRDGSKKISKEWLSERFSDYVD